MLRLIIGKAGTGKTGYIIEEIKSSVERRQGDILFVVPEQYSHEAERELCRRCGDTVSLYAEVMSFTGMARKLDSVMGGGAVTYLDKGGRLLCMTLALGNIYPKLKVFGSARRQGELQTALLAAVDELKAACITSEMLLETAADMDDGLGDKLRDLALILESYDAVVSNGRADPSDRLTRLAERIPDSFLGKGTKVYVDGFTDFTRQESAVLESLMRSGADVSVCLTVDSLSGDNEIFQLSRRAGRALTGFAQEQGIDTKTEVISGSGEKNDALQYFAREMFSYSNEQYSGDCGSIKLYRADSETAECELAAAECIRLVRDEGCRWRDIAVTARGFSDYKGTLESVFRNYGVPLYTAEQGDMLSKPLPSLISCAYDIILGGWDVDDVTAYMRTCLAGLSSEECDTLEDYIYRWQLRESAWKRRGKWHQHPEGYGLEYTEEIEERLEEIHALRRRLSKPLLNFEEKSVSAHTAIEHAQALSGLLEDLRLPETLQKRSQELKTRGQEKLAAEYRRLWELTVSAIEQFAAVLGDTAMDAEEFGRLFILMLSQYDIGTIPVSLDRVSAGDMDRNRRRSIKHLIVLGASELRLPRSDESAGVFSQEERRRLLESNIEIGPGGDDELWREFSVIYNSLTLPSESLTMSCPMESREGEPVRPAFVFNRAKAIFGISDRPVSLSKLRMSALNPAMSLAASGIKGGGETEKAALTVMREDHSEAFQAVERSAHFTRGKLSPEAVERLYGKKIRLSASRIDKFASCRFAYFCQYGLNARTREPSAFKPPEIGSFMHWVLENVARSVKERGGFRKVGDEEIMSLCDEYTKQYVREELEDFQEKTKRFRYLFERLCRDVRAVVLDTAQELRRSDFEPYSFELDFAKTENLPPLELGGGDDSLTLTGIADRVDGWVHDGTLYLRVVDYKTGTKRFSLSDVWYGMGLQMLLYLFALENGGESLYGKKIAPAGIMYVPARDRIIPVDNGVSDEEIMDKRMSEKRRSGLVVDIPALVEAWENGENKQYIPIKTSRGKPNSETVAGLERLGVLRRHIRKDLREMARQLRRGSIAADPFYRSQSETACAYCDYYDACHFSEGRDGEHCRYQPKLKPDKVWAMMEEGDKNE